jgi:hypothetical protein
MLCRNCGVEVPAGSDFCVHCGQRVDAVPQAQVAYALPDGAYPNAPQQTPKKPLSKGMKLAIFGGGGAVLLAVVLILVFTLSGGGGLLSGNTVQTKFVNENARFMNQMLEDFQVTDTSKMLSEPFDFTAEVTTEVSGESTDTELAMAYDQKAFGLMTDAEYGSVTLLLIGDELRVESYGSVQVIRFDTDADLDKNMTLLNRFLAIINTGDANIDYKKIVEILINSIPEDCFEKTGDSFTLTLDADALVDTLSAFSEAIENEEEINEAFNDFTKDVAGKSLDLSEIADMAAEALDSYSYDFKLVWEISYKNGAPGLVTISYEDESEYNDFTLELGYEKISGGKDIEISLETAGGYSDFSLEMTTTNTSEGMEFEGDIRTENDKVSIEGVQKEKGENFSIELNTDSSGGYDYSYQIEGTIIYGKPEKDVESDRRFDVDTDDASYYDLSELY